MKSDNPVLIQRKNFINKDFKEYIYKIRWAIMFIIFFTFLTHGPSLFTQRFGIDTDSILRGIHNFEMIGRQGLVWLSQFLGLDLDWFNLYYAQLLTMLFMALAPLSFGYLFHFVCPRKKGEIPALLALSLSFIVSPFWVSQIYFQNQSAQILLACTLTAVGIALTETARRDIRRNWYMLIAVLLLMQFTFSTYQVVLMIEVTGTTAVFLLISISERRTVKQLLQWIAFHAVVIVTGFIIYFVIAKAFYMVGEGYLTGQITWTMVSIPEGLNRCREAVLGSLRSTPPFYTGLYGFFCILFLLLLLYRLLMEKGRTRGSIGLTMLAAVFLCAAPYAFVFLYGGEILDRLQLVMPLSQGSMLYLTIFLLHEKGLPRTKLKAGLAKAAVLFLLLAFYRDTILHLNFCSRLYYTDEWVFQYTTRLAEKVYQDIVEVQNSGCMEEFQEASRDNILFLGVPAIPYNRACIGADVIGQSFFTYDADSPYPLRQRIFNFMEIMGYPIEINFSEDEVAVFQEHFADRFGEEVDSMPSYPDPGYIKCVSDSELGLQYLVVKLGGNWR